MHLFKKYSFFLCFGCVYCFSIPDQIVEQFFEWGFSNQIIFCLHSLPYKRFFIIGIKTRKRIGFANRWAIRTEVLVYILKHAFCQQMDGNAHRACRVTGFTVGTTSGKVHCPHDVPFEIPQRMWSDWNPLWLVVFDGATGTVAQRTSSTAGIAFKAGLQLFDPIGKPLCNGFGFYIFDDFAIFLIDFDLMIFKKRFNCCQRFKFD